MIIIPLLPKLHHAASDFFRYLVTPATEAEKCEEYLKKILAYLNDKGGYLVSVYATKNHEINGTTDHQIKIHCEFRDEYCVPKKVGSYPTARQQFHLSVNASTWKDFAYGLSCLEKEFEKNSAVCKDEKSQGFTTDFNNLMDGFRQHLRAAQYYAKRSEQAPK